MRTVLCIDDACLVGPVVGHVAQNTRIYNALYQLTIQLKTGGIGLLGLAIGIVVALFALKLGFDEDWHWIGTLIFAGCFVGLGYYLGIFGAIFGAVVLGSIYRALP